MQNSRTSRSWLILGAVFIIVLFLSAFLIKIGAFIPSGVVYVLISAIFGFGGALFLLIGIIKAILEKVRKRG